MAMMVASWCYSGNRFLLLAHFALWACVFCSPCHKMAVPFSGIASFFRKKGLKPEKTNGKELLPTECIHFHYWSMTFLGTQMGCFVYMPMARNVPNGYSWVLDSLRKWILQQDISLPRMKLWFFHKSLRAGWLLSRPLLVSHMFQS